MMNPELLSKSDYTRTDFFNDQTKTLTDKVMKDTGLSRKSARRIARSQISKNIGYKAGQLGASDVAGIPSRKERREFARTNKVEFKPVYNA